MRRFIGDLPKQPVVRLLEEALQARGSEDNSLTTEVLANLARALGVTGQQQQAMVYAERAVTMARRFDNPLLVAHSLYGMFFALMAPGVRWAAAYCRNRNAEYCQG